MAARTPEEICTLFQQYMAEGNLDGLLSLYDPEVVFLNRSGQAIHGQQAFRRELAPLAGARPSISFKIHQVIRSGGIALMHTEWAFSSPAPMTQYAIEVARRRPDGSWCWLIGDPFTVGKRHRVPEPSSARQAQA